MTPSQLHIGNPFACSGVCRGGSSVESNAPGEHFQQPTQGGRTNPRPTRFASAALAFLFRRCRMMPSDCKSERDLIRMDSTVWHGVNHWMQIQHDGAVIITRQKSGHPSEGSVVIERRTFQRMLDWYFKDQEPSK